MDMLTGEFRVTLDEKGRVLFPSKLRTELAGNVIIATQAIDRCLWLFTPDEWRTVSSKLMDSASPFSEKNRMVLRRFVAPAQELYFDRSGRVSIPQSLREYASLSKDCVLLGVSKYMELWNADAYRAYLAQSEDSFRDASEELGGIVF